MEKTSIELSDMMAKKAELEKTVLRVEESDRYVAVPFSLFSPLHPDLLTVPPGRGEP